VPSIQPLKLAKLVAAPELEGEVPSRARATSTDAGTASQLIPCVGRHADDAILWLATQAAFAGPERVLLLGTRALFIRT